MCTVECNTVGHFSLVEFQHKPAATSRVGPNSWCSFVLFSLSFTSCTGGQFYIDYLESIFHLEQLSRCVCVWVCTCVSAVRLRLVKQNLRTRNIIISYFFCGENEVYSIPYHCTTCTSNVQCISIILMI